MESIELNKDLYFRIMDYAQSKGYSYNTLKTYAFYLKRLIKKERVLNSEVLRRILKKIKHQNERAVLVLINDYCYFSNIDFRMVIPKVKSKPRSPPVCISLEESIVMVESSPKPYDLMIRCIFNIGAGLRISEAIKLSWDHINWVDWLSHKTYGTCLIKNSKGEKDRINNIPEKLMNDLYEYAKELKIINEFGVPSGSMIFECGLSNWKPDLFINNVERWKKEAVRHAYDWFRYNILQKCCEKALGRKIRIHWLRHGRATYLYAVEKVPIEKIQKLFKHSDIRTTLIYTEVDIKDTFEMIKHTKEI